MVVGLFMIVGEVTPESVSCHLMLIWEPMGSLGIEYDVHTNVRLFAEHHYAV